MRNSFFKTIYELAEKDDKVVFITGDLGFKLIDPIKESFPNRFFNAGVAEANMIGLAAGLALEGFKPWVYSIVPFVTLRCFEQIRNDIVFNNLNVKIVGVGGGYSYGINGPTHHAVEDIGMFRLLPNMTIVCPGDRLETRKAVCSLGVIPGPAYLRLGRGGEPVVHNNEFNFEIGTPTVLSKGNQVCLFSTGDMLSSSVEIGKILENNKISCSVISVHTVKPLDIKFILRECKNKKMVAVIEEHSIIGGLSSAIADCLIDGRVNTKFKRFAIPDKLNKTVGDQKYLKDSCGLSTEKIADEILGELECRYCN